MQDQWKKVCLVGGAGFIGSNLAAALAESVHHLRIVDDFSTGRRANLQAICRRPNVETIEGDIVSAKVSRQAVADMELVVDLACLGVRHSIGKPARNFRVNGNGTLSLLQEAHKVGLSRLVYISSSEVYGTALRTPMDENHPTYPMTVYGAGKLAGEALTRAFHRTYGLAATVIRPFNAYGPNSHHEGDSGEVIPRFIVRVMNSLPPVIFGDATHARDFTHVRDIVGGIIDVARCPALIGQTINLAFGRPRTVGEVAQIVLQAAGRPDLQPVTGKPRPGDVHLHYADTTLARQTLNWRPTIDLEHGIPMLLDHLRASGADFAKMLAEEKTFNWE